MLVKIAIVWISKWQKNLIGIEKSYWLRCLFIFPPVIGIRLERKVWIRKRSLRLNYPMNVAKCQTWDSIEIFLSCNGSAFQRRRFAIFGSNSENRSNWALECRAAKFADVGPLRYGPTNFVFIEVLIRFAAAQISGSLCFYSFCIYLRLNSNLNTYLVIVVHFSFLFSLENRYTRLLHRRLL